MIDKGFARQLPVMTAFRKTIFHTRWWQPMGPHLNHHSTKILPDSTLLRLIKQNPASKP